MFKKRRLGLQFKITFLIIAILFGMLVIKDSANMFLVNRISENLYGQLIKKTLEFDASYVQGLIKGPLDRLGGSKIIVQKLLNDDSINNRSLEGIMEFFLESSPNNIAASGIVFLDNAFDDMGASQSLNGFSSYVSRNPDGSIANRGFEPEEINADWYIDTLKTGKSFITDLYYFNVGGEDLLMYTWAEPLFDNNNRPIGVMTVDVLATGLQKSIQDSINLKDSELTVINHTGSVVSIKQSFSNSIGKNIYEVFPTSEEYDILGKKDDNEYFSFMGKNPVTKEDTLYAMLPVDIGNGNYWDSILSIPKKDLYAEANMLIKAMLIIAIIIILILSVLISLVIRKKFTFIMGIFATDLKKVSNGDLTLKVPKQVLDMNDEWGDIGHSFDFLITKMSEVIIQVKESSMEIKSAANEISDGNMDLSKRTEMQAASVEETSSSMEEMASTITNSSSNSIEANEIMSESKDAVKEAGAIISDTTSNIEDVLEASTKIENITKIIENIAFQTNILALNAAVEAARAGEQGRGFAVVASEVRNLAQTTQSSVKDITNLVIDVNEKIKKSTESAYRSKTIFDEIEIKIENGSKLISDISTTAVEQQSGIEEINKAIAEIDMAIQQNAALVEEATASSEAMLSQAKQLVDIVGFFKTNN